MIAQQMDRTTTAADTANSMKLCCTLNRKCFPNQAAEYQNKNRERKMNQMNYCALGWATHTPLTYWTQKSHKVLWLPRHEIQCNAINASITEHATISINFFPFTGKWSAAWIRSGRDTTDNKRNLRFYSTNLFVWWFWSRDFPSCRIVQMRSHFLFKSSSLFSLLRVSLHFQFGELK